MYLKIKLNWTKLYLFFSIILPIKSLAVLPDDLFTLNDFLCADIISANEHNESSYQPNSITFCYTLKAFIYADINDDYYRIIYTYINVMANENYSTELPLKNAGSLFMDEDVLSAIQNINKQVIATCGTPYSCPSSTPANS